MRHTKPTIALATATAVTAAALTPATAAARPLFPLPQPRDCGNCVSVEIGLNISNPLPRVRVGVDLGGISVGAPSTGGTPATGGAITGDGSSTNG